MGLICFLQLCVPLIIAVETIECKVMRNLQMEFALLVLVSSKYSNLFKTYCGRGDILDILFITASYYHPTAIYHVSVYCM